MRRRLVSAVGLLQAAAIVTIAFSLFTLLPSGHFLLQLFTHFRLQYFVAALVFAIVFAVLRDARYALALAATAALNGALVLPWYLDRPPAAKGVPLTLLQANVLSSNTERHRLLEFIGDEKPDVIALQEITPAWEATLSALAADYPHSLIEARDDNFGIALLSRRPLTAVSAVDSPPHGYPTIIADVDVDGRGIRIINSHPTIPVSRTMYDARNRQLENLADLSRLAGGPRVLVGDFNITMWESNYRSLEARSGLRSARRGIGVAPTWPTFFPIAMIPIDHVLVSSDVGVTALRTGPRIGSDHLPLVVTLTF